MDLRSRIPQSWLYYLVPGVLVLVACVQMTLVRTHDLTAWKGGGFGMFSTADAPSARTLRAWVLTEQGEALVGFPKLAVPKRRLTNMPSTHLLEEYAQSVASSEWVLFTYDDVEAMKNRLPEEFQRQIGRNRLARQAALAADSTVLMAPFPAHLAFAASNTPPEHDGVRAEVTGARVEVWRLTLDKASGTLRGEPIKSVTVTVP